MRNWTITLIVLAVFAGLSYAAASTSGASQGGNCAKVVFPARTSKDLRYSLCGDPDATYGLNDVITMKVDGAVSPDGKWMLRLDGTPLQVAARVQPNMSIVEFKLQRNADNRDLWARLLGSPLTRSRNTIPISLTLKDAPLSFVARSEATDQDERIKLSPLNSSLLALGMSLALAVVAATIVLAMRTSMIRDVTIAQMLPRDRGFSLGRTQMAFWFCLIFASFMFITIITYDINSITAQSLTLMGIAAATALGSVAVDSSKDTDKFAAIEKSVEAIGIASCDDAAKLAEKFKHDPASPAVNVLPHASIGPNLNPTVEELWDEYRLRTKDIRTDGFFKDLVNDANGPTIHRWQILVWTLILGGVYLVAVYNDLAPPNFSSEMLALMGISSGAYIGFKIPEKQS